MQVRTGYKQTEVGVVPEDWQIRTLGEVGDVKMCKRIFKNQTQVTGDIPFYKIGTFGSSPDAFISEALFNEYKSKFSFPKKGDVLISAAGTIGRTVIYDGSPAFFQDSNIIWIDNDQTKVSNEYIWHFYKIIKWSVSHGGIVARLYNANIKSIQVYFPNHSEQCAIATALSDVNELLVAQDKLIAKKRDIKQAAMQQLLTGKQRLPGFTGEWEVKRLGDVGEIVTGSTPPTEIKEYWNGSIPWITPTDISDKKDMFSSEREITLLGLQAIRNLPANSLLVTCIASIGKNAILRNKGACNQQINAIIPNDNNSVEFLYYLVENSKSYLLGNAGITATLMISKKDFSEISFSLPPIAEQTAIATILSDMDADLTALEQQRDKTRAIKQGMMQELLTGRTRLV